MRTGSFRTFDVVKDGLPNMDEHKGRLAFIFDGCIISGWPLKGVKDFDDDAWEAASDVGHCKPFLGIKKYVIFDQPIMDL